MSRQNVLKIRPSLGAAGRAGNGIEEESSNASDTVYERIFHAIVDHRLLPGTKLGEDKLADALQTTRTRVREALNRLAHEKIVVTYPHRGAFVAEPSIGEAHEILGARRVIEMATVAALARTATAGQIRDLQACVDREQEAWTTGQRKKAIMLSRSFHFMIADLAGNSVLSELLRNVVSRMSLAIALYDRPGRGDCFFGEHIGLVNAISAHDPDDAAAIMTRHFDHMEDQLNMIEDSAENRDLFDVFKADS
ncbi:MAG: GntR family transcriptional regulator [Rhodospirillales bacterium]|jgi:DNA-binding GntR family transcriptional regulator|nr:GntR family transcriptional regulator [Rhodospirillales bacterium]